MSNKKEVLLYSAGLDSFLTASYLKTSGSNPDLVYFDSGARCCDYEVDLMQSHHFKNNTGFNVEIRKELNFSMIEQDDAFIPNRNILAAVCAHGLKNYDTIYIGNSLSDRVNDNNEKVFNKLSELLSMMYDKEIKVTSPFYNEHKCDILKNGIEKRWLFSRNLCDIYNMTFSCYNPVKDPIRVNADEHCSTKHIINTHECGCCPACLRKRICFYYCGFYVPMVHNAESEKLIDKYYNEAISWKKLSNVNDYYNIMKSRFDSTIFYCERINMSWNRSKN